MKRAQSPAATFSPRKERKNFSCIEKWWQVAGWFDGFNSDAARRRQQNMYSKINASIYIESLSSPWLCLCTQSSFNRKGGSYRRQIITFINCLTNFLKADTQEIYYEFVEGRNELISGNTLTVNTLIVRFISFMNRKLKFLKEKDSCVACTKFLTRWNFYERETTVSNIYITVRLSIFLEKITRFATVLDALFVFQRNIFFQLRCTFHFTHTLFHLKVSKCILYF